MTSWKRREYFSYLRREIESELREINPDLLEDIKRRNRPFS